MGVVWNPLKIYHYIVHAPRPIFLVLTTTVTSVNESCVSRVAVLTFEGRGYYYGCLWLLDWHQMLWLILTHRIESWDLIWVCQLYRGYRLEACIYTFLFFTSFSIQNHSLCLFLGTFFSQNNTSLLHLFILLKLLVGGSEVSWGSCLFGLLRMYGAWPLPKPQLQGWRVRTKYPWSYRRDR